MFTGLLNPENSRPISDIKKNNLSKKTGTKELNNPNISKEINELETLVDE